MAVRPLPLATVRPVWHRLFSKFMPLLQCGSREEMYTAFFNLSFEIASFTIEPVAKCAREKTTSTIPKGLG